MSEVALLVQLRSYSQCYWIGQFLSEWSFWV